MFKLNLLRVLADEDTPAMHRTGLWDELKAPEARLTDPARWIKSWRRGTRRLTGL